MKQVVAETKGRTASMLCLALMALTMVALIMIGAFAGPAHADWHHGGPQPHREWRGRPAYYGRGYYAPPVVYANPAPAYYAPPPVVYSPQPESLFGINIGVR